MASRGVFRRTRQVQVFYNIKRGNKRFIVPLEYCTKDEVDRVARQRIAHGDGEKEHGQQLLRWNDLTHEEQTRLLS